MAISESQLMNKMDKIVAAKEIWVCSGCGKWRFEKIQFNDVSCVVDAVPTTYGDCVFGEDNRVKEVKHVREITKDTELGTDHNPDAVESGSVKPKDS